MTLLESLFKTIAANECIKELAQNKLKKMYLKYINFLNWWNEI